MVSAVQALVALACVGSVDVSSSSAATRRFGPRPIAWKSDLRQSSKRLLSELRSNPKLRTRVCGALGFALGLAVVPRTSRPDYDRFRTAEGWRQRLLSMKPYPLHQRMLMSVPIALAVAFAADPRGNYAYLRSRSAQLASTALRRLPGNRRRRLAEARRVY